MSYILIEQESGIDLVDKYATQDSINIYVQNILHRYLGLDEIKLILEGETVRGYSISKTNQIVTVNLVEKLVSPGILWNGTYKQNRVLARVIFVSDNFYVPELNNFTVTKSEPSLNKRDFLEELKAKIKEGKITSL